MKIKTALCIGVLALGSASEVNSAEMLLSGFREAARQGARTLSRYPTKSPRLLQAGIKRTPLARMAFGNQAKDLYKLPKNLKKVAAAEIDDSSKFLEVLEEADKPTEKKGDLSELSENLKKSAVAEIDDGSKLQEGLKKVDILAEEVLGNCVSELPENDPINIYASNFSSTLRKIIRITDSAPDEKSRLRTLKNLPESILYRDLRDSLDALRVFSHTNPKVLEKYSGAYMRIEGMVDGLGALGLNALDLNARAFPRKVMA